MEFNTDLSSPVNWTNHLIDGYYVSDLVMKFANITRFGTNFKPTHNVTLMDEENYTYAMVMYVVMAGIVALGFTLFLILFCCCQCLFRSAAKKPITKPPTNSRSLLCWNILVVLLALVGAGTFIVGFYGESRLHNGAKNVCHTINFTYGQVVTIDQKSGIILEEIDVSAQIQTISDQIELAKTHIANVPPPFDANLKKQVQEFEKMYQKISIQIDQATGTVKGKIANDILPKVIDKMKPIDDQCPTYVDQIRTVTLVALVVFAAILLLFIVGLCHNCLRVVTLIIGYLFLVLVMLFGTVSFVLLVAGSDFCLTSKPVVEKRINEPALNYYLWCSVSNYTEASTPATLSELPPLPTIPPKFDTDNLDHLFYQVRQLISSANQTVGVFEKQLTDQMNQFCTEELKTSRDLKEVCDNLDTIKNVLSINPDSLNIRISGLIDSVLDILEVVNCNSLTPEINDTLTNVCTTLYEAFFYFLINAVTATLCLYILLFVSTWLLFL